MAIDADLVMARADEMFAERLERQNGLLALSANPLCPHSNADDWPVLDPVALHGLAGEIVGELAPQTEADPVAVL